MYQFSDSETSDSDDGRRFKTATTRRNDAPRESNPEKSRTTRRRSRSRERCRRRSRSRSKSPRRHSSHKYRSHRRSRSRSREHSRRKRHESPVRHKSRGEEGDIKREKEKHVKSEVHNVDKVRNETDSCSKNEIASSCGPVPPKDNDSEVVCGPALPPQSKLQLQSAINEEDSVCGPALPPQLSKSSSEAALDDDISESSKSNAEPSGDVPCGPALPPHLANKIPNETNNEERCIGPFIPEHLRKQLAEQDTTAPAEDVAPGDTLEVVESTDDDDCYGPVLAEDALKSAAHVALEERALQLKLDQLTPATSDEKMREEWMIELPTVKASNLGLGPRQFRAKAGPDMSDRSSWTDTPGSKQKKPEKKAEDLKRTAELNELHKRDEEQEAMVKTSKKKHKRDKSLMELHQQKLNAKKKEDQQNGVPVRRPFNRDIDLKVNQFDEAQKKAIMKKAQLLDDRFSQGQSKFL